MIARTLAILTVLASATPAGAFAQTPAAVAATPTFAPSVRIGQNVFVTVAQGSEFRGRVAAITSTGIDLDTAVGGKHVPLSDVWMIHKKDSNREGFLIGAGVGLLASGLGAAASIDSDQRAAYIAVGTLFYGGIGALIDSAINGREMLFHRPEKSAAAVINITPIIGLNGPKRLGVGGTINWK